MHIGRKAAGMCSHGGKEEVRVARVKYEENQTLCDEINRPLCANQNSDIDSWRSRRQGPERKTRSKGEQKITQVQP